MSRGFAPFRVNKAQGPIGRLSKSMALPSEMQVRQGTVAEESEQMLLSAVARGDEAAVDQLFRMHGDAVLRFVYRRVEENLEDAQEITIDTFVSVLKLAGGFDPRSSVFTWLCGIAKVRIIDFYRKRDRGKRIPDAKIFELEQLNAGVASLDETLDRLEARRVVDAMLEGLNEDEREAILLRYVEGLSVQEAALLMKRSPKGVESLLTRAKAKARGTMEQWSQGGVR